MGTAARAAQAQHAAARREDEAAIALLLQTEEENMKRLRQQGQAIIRRLLSDPREGWRAVVGAGMSDSPAPAPAPGYDRGESGGQAAGRDRARRPRQGAAEQ